MRGSKRSRSKPNGDVSDGVDARHGGGNPIERLHALLGAVAQSAEAAAQIRFAPSQLRAIPIRTATPGETALLASSKIAAQYGPISRKRTAVELFGDIEAEIEKHGLVDCQAELHKLRAKYAGLQSAIRTLEKRLTSYDDGDGPTAEREAQHADELDAEVAQAEEEIMQLQKAVSRMSDQLQAAGARLEAFEGGSHMVNKEFIASREATLQVLRAQINVARKQLADTQAAATSLESMKLSMPTSSAPLTPSAMNGDELVAMQDTLEKRIHELKASLQDFEAQKLAAFAASAEAQECARQAEESKAQATQATVAKVATDKRIAHAQALLRTVIWNRASKGNVSAVALRILHEAGGQMPLSTLKARVSEALAGTATGSNPAQVQQAIFAIVGHSFITIDRSQADSLVLSMLV